MFNRVIERAVELFLSEEYDDCNRLLNGVNAWDWALRQVVQTDEDIYNLVAEIFVNPEYKSKVIKWKRHTDALNEYVLDNYFTDEERRRIVAGRVPDFKDNYFDLFGNEEFGKMVSDKIDGYDQIYAERRARAVALRTRR